MEHGRVGSNPAFNDRHGIRRVYGIRDFRDQAGALQEEFMEATLDPEYGRYKAIFNIFETNYGAASDMRSTLMVYLPTQAG